MMRQSKRYLIVVGGNNGVITGEAAASTRKCTLGRIPAGRFRPKVQILANVTTALRFKHVLNTRYCRGAEHRRRDPLREFGDLLAPRGILTYISGNLRALSLAKTSSDSLRSTEMLNPSAGPRPRAWLEVGRPASLDRRPCTVTPESRWRTGAGGPGG